MRNIKLLNWILFYCQNAPWLFGSMQNDSIWLTFYVYWTYFTSIGRILRYLDVFYIYWTYFTLIWRISRLLDVFYNYLTYPTYLGRIFTSIACILLILRVSYIYLKYHASFRAYFYVYWVYFTSMGRISRLFNVFSIYCEYPTFIWRIICLYDVFLRLLGAS